MLSSQLINTGKVAIGGRRRLSVGLVVVALAAAVAACGSSSASSSTSSAPVSVHIGYFPNITHAPALVGVADGIFAKDLAPDTLANPSIFSAGPAENQALLSGSIDIAFEGPSAALSAYSASKAVTVISGVASGGAGLVVNSKITSPAQLKGTTLGTPQLANTQDIALRSWLTGQGYKTTTNGGGDVDIQPSSTGNGTIVTEFKDGKIDGAWMPEPYEAELVADGGHVLVPESSLWPKGQWATTSVVVRNAFLQAHPATVKRFLTGLVAAVAQIKANPSVAEATTNKQLATLEGGKPLTAAVLASSFANLTFTTDPLASTYVTQVTHGEQVGLLKNPGPLGPVFDLQPLNAILKAKGQPEVSGP